MKKNFVIFFIFLMFCTLCMQSAGAIDYGFYKPETEYGLIDGFKFNGFKREKGVKFIELKSESKGEKERLEQEARKSLQSDEYQQYKFMQEGVVSY